MVMRLIQLSPNVSADEYQKMPINYSQLALPSGESGAAFQPMGPDTRPLKTPVWLYCSIKVRIHKRHLPEYPLPLYDYGNLIKSAGSLSACK